MFSIVIMKMSEQVQQRILKVKIVDPINTVRLIALSSKANFKL